MDTIRIHNIEIYAYHGVAREEQELGQRFALDIELSADLTAPARDDDLSTTLDYEAIYHAATQAFTSEKCRLLEHAAWRVLTALFDRFPAERITVRVRKPSAPVEGIFDAVEVELSRSREEVEGG